MGVNVAAFTAALPPESLVCLDTPPLVYHLEDIQPYSALTDNLLMRLGGGDIGGIVSTITITELLTKPFLHPDPKMSQTAEGFVQALPNCTIQPVTYEIARTAARLRALHGLRTPDALIAATAIHGKATHLVTNDPAFRRIASDSLRPLILDDHVIGR